MKILFLLILCLFVAFEQSELEKKTNVGYKVISQVDSSRIYKPGTKSSDKLHFRTIDIDLWYPATETPDDSLLRYGNFLQLFEKRANFYDDTKLHTNFANEFSKSLNDMFGGNDVATLLGHPTESYKNVEFSDGKYPLIIYLASYNGMCHENYLLFERFAKRGFVVAVITSIGRYPGDMTMDLSDMLEQQQDAAFAYKYLKNNVHVDKERIGLLGYSWGGIVAITAAMNKSIPALAIVSLDGSEIHPYGNTIDDDAAFDKIKNSGIYTPKNIGVPYLYIGSNWEKGQTFKVDSIYNSQSFASRSLYIRMDSAVHTDFACYSSIINFDRNKKNKVIYEISNKLTIDFFDQYLNKKSGIFDDYKNSVIGENVSEGFNHYKWEKK